ncbi:MAG: SPOR domain-containing protein [Burkholderiaceae bacterium]
MPLKKRARWRLIGACVLAMGAMIVLPFALESEPRRELGDVDIRMPPRAELGKMDRVLPVGNQAAQDASSGSDDAKAKVDAGPTRTASDSVVSAPPAGAAASVSRANEAPRPSIDPRVPLASQAPAIARRAPEALPKVKPAVAPPKLSAAGSPGKPEKVPAKSASSGAAKAPTAKADAEPKAKSTVATARAGAPAPPIPERRTNPNSIKAASPSGYVVQIGAFSSARGARTQVARGEKLGFKPYTETIKTKKGDRIRVRIGPYLTKKQASDARAKLRAAGIDTALIAP